MGRPIRQQDTSLAVSLEALVSGVGSVRKVAISLGIDATTLSRSLARKSFSEGTRKKVLARLPAATASLVSSPMSSQKAPEIVEELLQKLQKTNMLLMSAIAALEAASKKNESSEVINAGQRSS